jgi:hypothetical protein
MAERKWFELDRMSKIANCMYPHLSTKEIQKEVEEIAAREGKKSPLHWRLQQVRKSGKAK